MKRPSRPFSSLSVRLLLQTVAFVMLAEVLIYVPSIARFRLTYLEERIDAAHLASLALDATPNRIVSPELEEQLLTRAMVYAVVIKRRDSRSLMLGGGMPPVVDAAFDLRQATPLSLIGDAFVALWPWHRRAIRVVGTVAAAPDMVVEAILDAASDADDTVSDGVAINAGGYVPDAPGYYQYDGSKTTPPCDEPVAWFVMSETKTTSQEQVDKLLALSGGPNNRPVQPIGDRVIRASGVS